VAPQAISVFSMTCNCSYNYRLRYPITTWGEQLSIMVQLELLILLKLHFEDGGLLWRLPLGLALHALVAAACLTWVPAAVLVAVPIPLSCVSTLPQLLTNHRRRSTGQLALLPTLFAVLGLSIRVFTSITETGDPWLIASQLVPLGMQALLLVQLLSLPGGDGQGDVQQPKAKAA
jgi:mannose-P-dolichol utilization defect protein 1